MHRNVYLNPQKIFGNFGIFFGFFVFFPIFFCGVYGDFLSEQFLSFCRAIYDILVTYISTRSTLIPQDSVASSRAA